MIKGYTQKM